MWWLSLFEYEICRTNLRVFLSSPMTFLRVPSTTFEICKLKRFCRRRKSGGEFSRSAFGSPVFTGPLGCVCGHPSRPPIQRLYRELLHFFNTLFGWFEQVTIVGESRNDPVDGKFVPRAGTKNLSHFPTRERRYLCWSGQTTSLGLEIISKGGLGP